MIPNRPDSKRAMLYSFVKQTKDVYLPTISNSLSQLKNEAKRTYQAAEDLDVVSRVSGFGSPTSVDVPSDSQIVIYPSYTRLVNGSYETEVRGWFYAPGQMTRRNRLIMSLCNRLARGAGSETMSNLENVDRPMSAESVVSDGDSVMSMGSYAQEEPMRTRLSRFLARSLGSQELHVIVGAEQKHTELIEKQVVTDANGNFSLCISTPYKPSLVQVSSKLDDTLFSCSEATLKEPGGYGLISDIDDTIKRTGVLSDKVSLFNNVFVADCSKWEIPDMMKWYNTLHDDYNVDFFYVSNSPYQLFGTLHDFFFGDSKRQYPEGPMFLKQYSGNLINSIMTSSAQRKLVSIRKIMNDFPHKKFILVGDSGEMDLEAYVSTAVAYPNQCVGIYIRCVEGSLSDFEDSEILHELNALIQEKYTSRLSASSPDLIDLHSSPASPKRVPPPLPRKKSNLISDIQAREIRDSKLPPREHCTQLNCDREVPPPLPARNLAVEKITPYIMPSSQNDFGMYSSYFDKRGDSWKKRIVAACVDLRNAQCHIEFKLFANARAVEESSKNAIK